MAFRFRPARPDDYDRFVRAFAELGVDDPVPSREGWTATMLARTSFLERDGDPVGYTFFDVLEGTGYVRHVVVDPSARRSGVGLELMRAIADALRARGCTSWCLNVKQDNVAAIALYERVGMKVAYESIALRLPWAATPKLPRPRRDVDSFAVTEMDDAIIETTFDLPRGMIAGFRSLAGQVLAELRDRGSGAIAGFARFVPARPGAFPFRVASPDLAFALLEALRPHARAEHDWIALTLEADAALVKLVEEIGADVTLRLFHMRGEIPAR